MMYHIYSFSQNCYLHIIPTGLSSSFFSPFILTQDISNKFLCRCIHPIHILQLPFPFRCLFLEQNNYALQILYYTNILVYSWVSSNQIFLISIHKAHAGRPANMRSQSNCYITPVDAGIVEVARWCARGDGNSWVDTCVAIWEIMAALWSQERAKALAAGNAIHHLGEPRWA